MILRAGPNTTNRPGEPACDTAQVVTGDIIDGSLPHRAARLVGDWIGERRKERVACWERAMRGAEPGTIEPLRQEPRAWTSPTSKSFTITWSGSASPTGRPRRQSSPHCLHGGVQLDDRLEPPRLRRGDTNHKYTRSMGNVA